MEIEDTDLMLQTIVEDPLMRHSAILVFANKQDLVRLYLIKQIIFCAIRVKNSSPSAHLRSF